MAVKNPKFRRVHIPSRKQTFFQKVGGFIARPADTFKALKDESLGKAFGYYALINLISSVILGVLFGLALTLISNLLLATPEYAVLAEFLSRISMAILIPVSIVVIYALNWIGLLLSGLIIHLGVLAFARPHKRLSETYKVIAYGSTPGIFNFISIIPYMGELLSSGLSIWSMVLNVIGLKEYHETSLGRAIAALLIISFAFAILLVTLLVWIALTL